jgi:hypothetical protein
MLPWDAAFVLLEAGMDREVVAAALGMPAKALLHPANAGEALRVFARIAQADPAGANAALNVYLMGRSVVDGLDLDGRDWVTSLPVGLHLAPFGGLNLRDTAIEALPPGLTEVPGNLVSGTRLAALPEGLNVWGNLILTGAPIVTLPAGLRVAGGNLFLNDCHAWDGKIPPDAQVKALGILYTPRHPEGISLSDWRSLHPRGERT